MPADSPVAEFWGVVNGEIPGRENAMDVTLFDSVGFALEDYSALRYVLETAQAFDIGSTIELVPQLADPKDLFARLIVSSSVSTRKRA